MLKRVAYAVCFCGMLVGSLSLFEARAKAEPGVCCQYGDDCPGTSELCCSPTSLGALNCSSTDPDRGNYCVQTDNCYRDEQLTKN